ncbi:MAG: Glycerol-3-phosphate acyltransferase [bacterium ADurb.Bin212]|nr:MAG: Glycerol-3-phosphate acyltransferase [bacterium ADurb.Bin212]
MFEFLAVALSYIWGSLPFGYTVGKLAVGKGFDIRNHGSESIGFTNVWRVLGMKVAIPVLILDLLKGYLPVAIAMHTLGVTAAWLCLIAVMIGHAKSLYFRLTEGHFSGGKSAASAMGGIVALQPVLAGWVFLFFLAVLLVSRTMSVSSMLASFCAVWLSYHYELGHGWHTLFWVVAVLIMYTHRRNLGRLAHGTENKMFEWSDMRWPWQKKPTTKEQPEILAGFVIHAMDWRDLLQSIFSWWIGFLGMWERTRPIATWILAHVPVIENAEIRNIRLKDGRRVRVLVLAIPWVSSMIKQVRYANEIDEREEKIPSGSEGAEARDEVKRAKQAPEYRRSKWFRDRLWQRLRSTAVQTRRRGCSVLGLGALLSTEFNGGADLQKWCNARGLDLTVDNGAAYTAVSTVQAVIKETPMPLDQAKVKVVGASGFIGRITAKYMEKLAAQVTVIGRDEAKLTGFSQSTAISTALEDAYDGDVVVLLTSAPGQVVNLENCTKFKPGATFMDGARPVDFDEQILKEHPELNFKLVRCGVIKFPQEEGRDVLCGVDFHFDGYYPACVAQCVMVAAGGEEGRSNATNGASIRPAKYEYFANSAEACGLEVITSRRSEGDVFEGNYN